MTPDDDATAAATLDRDACTRLLVATQFGRLAVVDEGKPVIVVLNHVVDGSAVLFRTTEDARLARLATDGRVVNAVFEVDSAFAADRSGWSVIATGRLSREQDAARAAVAVSRIATWAQGQRDVVLRLDIDHVDGRRVGPLTR